MRTTRSYDVEEQLLVITDPEQDSLHALGDDTASSAFPKKLIATVDVNGQSVRFQLDSGANCDIIRECDLPPDTPVTTTTRTLLLYDRSKVAPVGECSLRVRRPHTPTWFRGSFLVVRDAPLSILGSSSSQRLGYIEVRREFLYHADATTRDDSADSLSKNILLDRFPAVFADAIGAFPGVQHLDIDTSVTPTQIPTRRIPVAIKQPLQDELARLEAQGVVSRVTDPTPWVSACLTVPKSNGRLRVCLDPKPLNRALRLSHYHMPTLDDVLSELAHAKVFSIADVRNGFWHVVFDAVSRLLTTFGTPFGRFCWNRLPFGITNLSTTAHRMSGRFRRSLCCGRRRPDCRQRGRSIMPLPLKITTTSSALFWTDVSHAVSSLIWTSSSSASLRSPTWEIA